MNRAGKPDTHRARLTVHAIEDGPTVDRHIYGHFAEHLGRCIYDGLWVGPDSTTADCHGLRPEAVEALREMAAPNLRWPGGCFADTYDWRDGIGPRPQRPRRRNHHWGGALETNAFGTQEFFELCERSGALPYLNINLGSGSPREMMAWLEYITCDGETTLADLRRSHGREAPWELPFLGIGNENWGCGGRMRPEYYADLYRQYALFAEKAARERPRRVAVGTGGGMAQSWNDTVLSIAGAQIDLLAIHYYTFYRGARTDTEFDEEAWFDVLEKAMGIESFLRQTRAVLEKHDPEGRIGLAVDEWGTWYSTDRATLHQQNTLRDALVAGVTLNCFNRHADRVRLANIAQLANVLQSPLMTHGGKLVRTPTYHAFAMHRVHQDATRLPLHMDAPVHDRGDRAVPLVDAAASRDAKGAVHLTFCNIDPARPAEMRARVEGAPGRAVTGETLTAEAIHARNTFDQPEAVTPAPFENGAIEGETLTAVLPPKSLTRLTIAP